MSELLNQSVTELPGVGKRIAQHLQKLHINTVLDLLFHLPTRYQDRTRIIAIRDTQAGDHCIVQGMIEKTEINFAKRRSLICTIHDGTTQLLSLIHI